MPVRRWLRYNVPVMVLIEMEGGDDKYEGETEEKIIKVVLAAERDDAELARDFRGHFLFYDEAMQPTRGGGDPIDNHALWIADHDDWPDRIHWEEGPDPLTYPDFYTDDPDDDPEDDWDEDDEREADDED